MMDRTAHEITEEFDVRGHVANIFIDGQIQKTIVYTLDEVNKLLNNVKGYNEGKKDVQLEVEKLRIEITKTMGDYAAICERLWKIANTK